MRRLNPLIKAPKKSSDPQAYVELKDLYLDNAVSAECGSVRAAFREFAAKLDVDSFSVLLPSEPAGDTFAETYACIGATNLELVDTSRASWDQIMELRGDHDSRDKLRRLRLFFFENYLGKNREFIEDDLMKRIHDYHLSRKKHGFDAVASSLSVLLEAKTIQAAAVAGISAALFGGPIAALTAGAVVELGKVALEVTKQRAQIRNLADGHELGYIIKARGKL